jgi:hypothetical protein
MKNVFNPENIEEGDTVRLNSDGKRGKHRKVTWVGGSHGNKVMAEGCFTHYYAQCFKLVKKGKQ